MGKPLGSFWEASGKPLGSVESPLGNLWRASRSFPEASGKPLESFEQPQELLGSLCRPTSTKKFNSAPGPSKMPKLRSIPARICFKTAVSAQFHKRNSIAGPVRPKCQISAPKRLPARIWCKKAFSAQFHKRNSIAGPGRPKCQISAPKRLPARIWLKEAVSAQVHKRNSIAGPGRSKCQICAPKARGQDLLQKSRFGSSRSFPEASAKLLGSFEKPRELL